MNIIETLDWLGEKPVEFLFKLGGMDLCLTKKDDIASKVVPRLAKFLQKAKESVWVVTPDLRSEVYGQQQILTAFEILQGKGVQIEIIYPERVKNTMTPQMWKVLQRQGIHLYEAEQAAVSTDGDRWLIDGQGVMQERRNVAYGKKEEHYFVKSGGDLATSTGMKFEELKAGAKKIS